jgi:hypothetical protein
MMRTTRAILAVAVIVAGASLAEARPGAAGPDNATSSLQVSLKLGEDTPYRFGGEGTCQHAANGSIYDAPAELWSVRHAEARRSLTLSFWRVKGQGDMLTFGISIAGESHRVSTVRIGAKGNPEGSGRATFTSSGNGGAFSIDVVASDGTPIKGTIACGRFTPIVEEGGD